MPSWIFFLCSVIVTMATAEETKPTTMTAASKAFSVIAEHNRFAFRFYGTTMSKPNSFFAPFSIASSLIMLYLGTDGETAQELDKALGFNFQKATPETFVQTFVPIIRPLKERDRTNYLSSSSAVLVHTTATILWSYEQLLKFLFGVTIARQDFLEDSEDVLEAINNWVHAATRKKLKTILESSLDLDTHMLLMNAVYFKGTWAHAFDKNQTVKSKFYNNGQHPKDCSMMTHASINCRYASTAELQMLELPYTGKNLSMVLLLPKKRDGLADLQKNLTYEKIQGFLGKLADVEGMHVVMPKFRLEYSTNVIPHLNQLGITSLFTTDADLSKMSNDTSLLVSDYKHKTTILVNETGTDSSAASAIEATYLSSPKDSFVADHPFIFFIHDTRDKLILFLGRLEEL